FQLKAGGKDEAALGLLLDGLSLSCALQHGATRMGFDTARIAQGVVFKGIEHWAAGTRQPALLRRALTAVERQESTLPPFTDVLKAEFLVAYPLYLKLFRGELVREVTPKPQLSLLEEGSVELFLLAQEWPWEHERVNRLLRYRYGRALGVVPPDDR